MAALAPAEFVERYLARDRNARSSPSGRASASGAAARATSTCCARSGSTPGRCRSSRASRRRASGSSRTPASSAAAAELLGRPLEVDGTVVSGDRRGKTLGFPTANLRVDPHLLVPGFGIYAGAADGKRAAISIGVNPHYGGTERRIEAYLLDWEGDLYGDRLVVELWRRLRDERAFESEADLVAQIARDVEETRAATRPG